MESQKYNKLVQENAHLKHLLQKLKTISQKRILDNIDNIEAPDTLDDLAKKFEPSEEPAYYSDLLDSLHNYEERFKHLFKYNNDAIIIIDRKGIPVEANPKALKLLSYPLRDLKHISYKDLIEPGHSEIGDILFKELLNNETFIYHDGVLVTKENEKLPVDLKAFPLRNVLGEFSFFALIIKDIREKEKAEVNLQSKNSEIESLKNQLQSMKVELNHTKDDLEQKKNDFGTLKKKYVDNEKLKTAFLTNLNHEIRTPMNGILGFSTLLKSKMNHEKRNEYVSIIHQSGIKLLRLVDNVVDMAKIETGQLIVNNYKNDLKAICTNLFNSYHAILEDHKQKDIVLKLDYQLNKDQSLIWGDGSKVHHVLDHLLDNAVKFTNKGEIKFGVKLKKNQLLFFIKDTGIGIPEHKKDLVFHRFRQLDHGSTRGYPGAGLGLSVSKGLVKRMKGEIWVKSVKDEGSAFYFTLPYSQYSVNSNDKFKVPGQGTQDLKQSK